MLAFKHARAGLTKVALLGVEPNLSGYESDVQPVHHNAKSILAYKRVLTRVTFLLYSSYYQITEVVMEDKYKTEDMGEATALLSLGEKIIGVEEGSRNNKKFVFEKSSEIEKHVFQYLNDELMVNAKKYFYSMRQIKTLIYK